MKKVKRTASVLLLIATLTLVGYLVYTGSRLFGKGGIDDCRNATFYASGVNTFVSIDNELATVYVTEEVETDLTFVGEKDGVLRFTDGEKEYVFLLLSDGTLFDTGKKLVLYRGY